jgi:membrane associated rhomboid family serine protease
MDWSLVLVSQGIESTIENDPELGWGLRIDENDCGKAVDAIRQYRRENRGWPWQAHLFRHEFLFDWVSLAWVVLLVLFFELDEQNGLQARALMEPAQVLRGEWWRLFTAIWLHEDVAHLAMNATVGLLLLGLAMARLGTGLGLLAAYLAGAGGNLLVVFLLPHRGPGLGSSGMVMGMLGLLGLRSLEPWRRTSGLMRRLALSIGAAVMLFVLLALNPGTDVLAHLGGFLTGLLIGWVVSQSYLSAKNAVANVTAGLVFCLLVIVPWWLALRR